MAKRKRLLKRTNTQDTDCEYIAMWHMRPGDVFFYVRIQRPTLGTLTKKFEFINLMNPIQNVPGLIVKF